MLQETQLQETQVEKSTPDEATLQMSREVKFWEINIDFKEQTIKYLKNLTISSLASVEEFNKSIELIKLLETKTILTTEEFDKLIAFMEKRPFYEVFKFFAALEENVVKKY
jgi:hypothetical protein